MESMKKKRNSILRKPKEKEEEIKTTVVRSNKKISFNRRASVREFTASEETKAWDNSYDVSDPRNNSEDTAGEKSIHKNATKCMANEIVIQEKEDVHINVDMNETKESGKSYKNFDFTLLGNEADHFQSSRSLSVETTTLICRDLENSTSNSKSSKNMHSDNYDMDISQPVSQQKGAIIFTASHVEMNLQQETLYINENVDESLPTFNKIQYKTMHFNDDLEPTIFKTEKSHFCEFKIDEENSMDMSFDQHKNDECDDISMSEISFGENYKEEPMEITSVRTPQKSKNNVVVKHTVMHKKLANKIENQDVQEEKTKYFDESICNFNVEDSKKESTTLLANASLDSDPTFHEYLTHNGGAKLNFLELNEIFEKGHVKAFSHTPPIKKFNTPKKNQLKSMMIFNDSNLDLSLRGSKDAAVKQNDICTPPCAVLQNKTTNNTYFMAVTPCSVSFKDKLESSDNDFIKTENEIFDDTHKHSFKKQQTLIELESMRVENEDSSTSSKKYNRRHTIRTSQDIVEDEKKPAANNRRYTVLAPKDMIIDDQPKNSVNVQNKNKRFTVLATKEMILDENQEVYAKNVEQKNSNRRQTVLVPHDMTMDESLRKSANNTSPDKLETENNIKHTVEHLSQLKLMKDCTDMQNSCNFTVHQEMQLEEPKARIKSVQRLTINAPQQMELEANKDADEYNNGHRLTISETQQMELINNDKSLKPKYDREICKSSTFMGNEDIAKENEQISTNKEYNRKRLTYTSNDSIELDKDKENIEENKQDLDYQRKRLNFTSNGPIELDKKENESELNYCRKRLTFTSDDPMELEQDYQENKVYSTQDIRSKRLTVNVQEQMKLENEQSEEDKYGNKSIKINAAHKNRLTITNAQQMEVEKEVEKNKDKRLTITNKVPMEIEKEEEVVVEFSKASNKRLTITNKVDMDLEDAKENISISKMIINKLLTEMNCTSAEKDEKTIAREEKIKSIMQRRLTLTSTENMEIVTDKNNIKQAEVEVENQRKSQLFSYSLAYEAHQINMNDKHCRKTKRYELDKSLESDSPLSKRCNQMETPNRNRKSHIPIPINSAKKHNNSSLQIINLDNSLDTIPIPRRLYKPMDKSVVEILPTKKAVEVFEDNPITLSDSSIFAPIYKPAAQEAEPSLLVLEHPRYSMNTTVGNMLNFFKLSSTPSSMLENESALKLVSQEESMRPINVNDSIDETNENNIAASIVSLPAESFVAPKKQNMLPDIGLKELIRLKQQPSLWDALSRPRRFSLDLAWNLNDITPASPSAGYKEEIEEDEWFKNFKQRHNENMAEFAKQQKEFEINGPQLDVGIDRLCKLIEEQTEKWTINKRMRYRKIIEFKHKDLPKACFVLVYENKEDIWEDVEIKNFYIKDELFKPDWLPMHHLIYFQLKMELPLHMKDFYKCYDYASFVECLQYVGAICQDIRQLSLCLIRILFHTNTTLIRMGIDTYARKIVRRLIWKEGDEIPDVQKAEFRVVLRHMRQTNYTNIEMPRLHLFHENVQLLPSGLDFIQQFFEDPEKYIK